MEIHESMYYFQRKLVRIVGKIILYALLTECAFVFLYPLIFMLINSLKSPAELLDLNSQWIVSSLYWKNYVDAIAELQYENTLPVSVFITVLCTIGHIFSCSFIAYGLTRFKFHGRKFLIFMVILTILVPPQILQIPLYIQYAKMGWIGTILPIVVPCFFGGGLKGGLFIFIFCQFFKGIPKVYEEAAKLEGCNNFYIYLRILLPMSTNAISIVATLSAVWHWNDLFESTAYLNGNTNTLMQKLYLFPGYLYENNMADGRVISQTEFAACVLSLIPIASFFLIMQKHFIQGMENSGLANS